MKKPSKSIAELPFNDVSGYRIWRLNNDGLRFNEEAIWISMINNRMWDCLHDFLSICNDDILNERNEYDQGWCHLYVLNDNIGEAVPVFTLGFSRLSAEWSSPDIFNKTPMHYCKNSLVAQKLASRVWIDTYGKCKIPNLASSIKERKDLKRVYSFWGLL